MCLETHVCIKRYIYRLYKLEQNHICLKEAEQKVRVPFPSPPVLILMTFLGRDWVTHTKHQRSFLEKFLLEFEICVSCVKYILI